MERGHTHTHTRRVSTARLCHLLQGVVAIGTVAMRVFVPWLCPYPCGTERDVDGEYHIRVPVAAAIKPQHTQSLSPLCSTTTHTSPHLTLRITHALSTQQAHTSSLILPLPYWKWQNGTSLPPFIPRAARIVLHGSRALSFRGHRSSQVVRCPKLRSPSHSGMLMSWLLSTRSLNARSCFASATIALIELFGGRSAWLFESRCPHSSKAQGAGSQSISQRTCASGGRGGRGRCEEEEEGRQRGGESVR